MISCVISPSPCRRDFKAELAKHRLRREIISNVVTNSLVNRAGPTFVAMLKENTGMPAAAIARAYAVTRGVFDLRDIWGRIEALDTKVPAALQTEMLIETTKLAESRHLLVPAQRRASPGYRRQPGRLWSGHQGAAGGQEHRGAE